MKRWHVSWRRVVGVCLCMVWSGLFVLAEDAARLTPHWPEPRHGLSFTNPVTLWDEALPLGNGLLGALVWGDGRPVRISLDRTDLWDLTPVPEFSGEDYRFATMRRWHEEGRHGDLVRVYEQPYHRPAPTKIPAGRIELDLGLNFNGTRLDLATAEASMSFQGGGQLRVFVHATEPVGVMELTLPEETVAGGAAALREVRPRLLAPPFGGEVREAAAGGIGAGDLAQLGYPPPELGSGDQWRSYIQTGALGFRFAAYVGWRVKEDRWIGVWSIASSRESGDPAGVARDRVERVLSAGTAPVRESHRGWWRQYWAQSTVTLPNPVIERQWYLDTYKFGAASRRGAPPITLQGPWTADDGQLPPWKGDYHHDLNTQLSYWPCYSGNRLQEGLAYLDWLWETRSNCVAWTRAFFGKPGLNVPMTADLNNRQIGGWRQYTHSSTTAAWLAQHFYWHWQFSGDAEFLRERAYPYLRQASVFLEAMTRERDGAGRRTLPLSASPEIHDNRPEAWFDTITNYDLALVSWLWEATAELAEAVGEPDEARVWRGHRAELPELSTGESGQLLVARGAPLGSSHRHFSHLMAIHPLGLLDVRGAPESRRRVEASLEDLKRLGTDGWCGYSFAWLANLEAWALDGAAAAEALEIFSTAFTLRNSFHCNGDQSGRGYSKFRYRPFTLEGNFAAAAGVQEMLLQSQRGVIEVFPAVPPSWQDVQFTTLRARGGFLVSAERLGGLVTRLDISSERGGLCRVRLPQTGEIRQFNLQAGEIVHLGSADRLREAVRQQIAPEDLRWLRQATAQQLQGCRIQGQDGVWLHTPDGVGSYRALWTRDFQYMVEYAGDLLDPKEVEASIRYLLKGQRHDGCMPDRVDAAGRAIYSPGGASSPLADLALDNGAFMAKLAVHSVERSGDLDFFREVEPALRRGLDHTPRSGNGLVYNPPDQPQCPYGFTDTVAKTGHLLFCSLLYEDACRAMERLCRRAGCGDPDVYRRRSDLIRAHLKLLWDETAGMFNAADGDCRQIDIWGSALAVQLACVTDVQARRIAAYLADHYEEITQRGQVRHLPAGEYWDRLFVGIEPGTYQNGAFWGTPVAWVAPTIARHDLDLAVRMIREVIGDYRQRGITECVNGDYHNVRDYVVSAASVYAWVR